MEAAVSVTEQLTETGGVAALASFATGPPRGQSPASEVRASASDERKAQARESEPEMLMQTVPSRVWTIFLEQEASPATLVGSQHLERTD